MPQRSGYRKPIVSAEEPQEKKEKTQTHVQETEELDEAEQKRLEELERRKRAKKLLNEVVKLKPVSNIKNLMDNFNSTLLKDKDKQELSKKNEKRKQKVKLVTTGLLLGYNCIRDMEGIHDVVNKVMHDAVNNLQWLDLQHNYLTTLNEDIINLKNLKVLYLHCNFIFDLKEFLKLKKLENLTTLTVHGNPIVRIPNFRLYLIYLFPKLKRLDTVLVTKEEKDNANVWVNIFNLKLLPAYVNSDCPKPPENINQGKENEDQ